MLQLLGQGQGSPVAVLKFYNAADIGVRHAGEVIWQWLYFNGRFPCFISLDFGRRHIFKDPLFDRLVLALQERP